MMLVPLPARAAAGVSVASRAHFIAYMTPSTMIADLDTSDALAGPAAAALGVVAALGTTVGVALLAVIVGIGSWAWYESYILSLRAQRFRPPSSAKSRSVDSSSPAYVAPREVWLLDELKEYDGRQSEDGPILLAANGLVYNVAFGRDFYGPGGEYEVMAGRDASRYLAKNSVEPETEEQASVPLNVAERAALSAWLWSFERKYDCVGRVASPDEAERLAAADAYFDRMEEIECVEETRKKLQESWQLSVSPDSE